MAPLPRPKPVEAMQACPERLAELEATVPTFPVEEALRAVLRARIADASAYFECRRRQQELVRWINDDDS